MLVLSWNVNIVEEVWDGVTQSGYGIWQIGEESGSTMNPGSWRDGRVRVYRRRNERFALNCVVEVDNYGGGSAMV
jgi:hypothetical protein